MREAAREAIREFGERASEEDLKEARVFFLSQVDGAEGLSLLDEELERRERIKKVKP